MPFNNFFDLLGTVEEREGVGINLGGCTIAHSL